MLLLALPALLLAAPAVADGGVTFTEIADEAGITYERQPNPVRAAAQDAVEALGTIPNDEWRNVRATQTPMKPWGSPGVALLDYDRDGDLDIYVTNGPGAANSLYSNQLADSGELTFVDVAMAAGIDATAQDSAGICYGDIDNDGDDDIYVLGTDEPNRLFESQLAQTGDAVYTDITDASGAGGGDTAPSGCSMADFDNDGLLDIVIGNTYTGWAEHRRPTFVNEVCDCLQPNQLFMNQGGNVFVDEGPSSGLQDIDNMPAGAAYSWAIAAVDVDQDGDVDVLSADTQGPAPQSEEEERGYNRLFLNDGTGHFEDVTDEVGLAHEGSWMGTAWADLDCNGALDFFSTNLGDYVPGSLGFAASRWFLQNPDGTWEDPGVGDMISSAFGWGVVATDYDNDGDSDIVYHGGMDVMTVIVAENPGVVLQNEGCTADFEFDFDAIPQEHQARIVEGVATGDLNNDGFDDLVSVADSRVVPGDFWLPWSGILAPPYDSELDPHTRFEGVWIGDAEKINFLNPTVIGGDLSVEINSGDNGNSGVAFDLVGGAGTVWYATANRSAVGAIARFTPDGGPTSIRPVVAGASYASQDELTRRFGLGDATSGDLEVIWPGGVRNVLHDVQAGERLTIPEIPCDASANWGGKHNYNLCVLTALRKYKRDGIIDPVLRTRLRKSAFQLYDELH